VARVGDPHVAVALPIARMDVINAICALKEPSAPRPYYDGEGALFLSHSPFLPLSLSLSLRIERN